jgi:toxin ParE1/3/4
MDFKVLISDRALADLKEIVEFVAEDDPGAALRLGEKLLRHALTLQSMPSRFPFYDMQRGIRKMTLAPYLVFYTCDESSATVSILHFWHGARRAPR